MPTSPMSRNINASLQRRGKAKVAAVHQDVPSVDRCLSVNTTLLMTCRLHPINGLPIILASPRATVVPKSTYQSASP